MTRPTLQISRARAFAICLALSISAAQALSAPVNECVGRMQFTLPGDAEIATSPRAFLDYQFSSFKRLNASPPPSFQFVDGTVAGFSHLRGIAVTSISHPLDATGTRDLRSAFTRDRDERAIKRQRVSGKPPVERIDVGVEGDGSRTAWKGTAVIKVADRLALLSVQAERSLRDSEQSKRIEASLKSVVTRLVARPFGEIPSGPGLCLPYAFLRDEGSEYRDIAVTYRLKEHPDVLIVLKDSVASKPAGDQQSRSRLAQYQIDDFLSQYVSSASKLKSMWSPAYRSFSVAKQDGLKSFVKYVGRDGSEDFGFAAALPGNAEAKTDEPDLMLYVVRDTQAAKSKDIAPLDADSLLRMAEEIAASIRRRP